MKAINFNNPLKYTGAFKAIMATHPDKMWKSKTKEDLYVEDLCAWTINKTPIIIRLVFYWDNQNFIHTIQFPKYTKSTNTFSTYMKGSFEYVACEDYTFSFVSDIVSIDVGDEELHMEPMNFFDFAVGIDQFDTSYTWISQKKSAGIGLPTILNIPSNVNFFKKFNDGLPF